MTGDHAARERAPSAALALGAALLGFFVVTLDAIVVSVALPSIGHDLGGGITGLQWVVDAYTIMFAALLLSAGAFSDRVGANRAFAFGIALFIASSAVCGLAQGLGWLILGRFVQGAAAAVVMPSSLALVRHAYGDSRERARAIAIWGMGGAAAAAAGPVIGGLATLAGWQMIFFINLPVGAVALILVVRVRSSPRRAVPIDWPGQAAAIVAIAAFTFALIEGGAAGFESVPVVLALFVAAAGASSFVVAEASSRHPMVPLALRRSRSVAIASSVGFAFTFGYYGTIFVLSLYFQQERGLSPLETGLVFLPMMALVVVLYPPATRVAERVGARASIAAGLSIMALGLLALAIAVPTGSAPELSLLLLMVGLGGPFSVPPVTAVLLDSVAADLAGTASGVLNTTRQLGVALGVAVFGALAVRGHTFTDGLVVGLLIAGLLLFGTAALSLRLRVANPDVRSLVRGSAPNEAGDR